MTTETYIAWLGHWWLWQRRGTIFDSRQAWVARGVASGEKLDRGEKVNVAECEDALSWDKYCTGGDIKWMLERWLEYERGGLLPSGEWTMKIRLYTARMYDDARSLLA